MSKIIVGAMRVVLLCGNLMNMCVIGAETETEKDRKLLVQQFAEMYGENGSVWQLDVVPPISPSNEALCRKMLGAPGATKSPRRITPRVDLNEAKRGVGELTHRLLDLANKMSAWETHRLADILRQIDATTTELRWIPGAHTNTGLMVGMARHGILPQKLLIKAYIYAAATGRYDDATFLFMHINEGADINEELWNALEWLVNYGEMPRQ
ncbi:MAG: hypothetical protein LBJ42_00350 [Holosporales bacterium]|jgi:hypothetical protein|nr:hypothetical protein [Holosporales bacterium]